MRLFCQILFFLMFFMSVMPCFAALSANQTISAFLYRGDPGGGGGGGGTGGIIAGGVVGGSAATGATALAFAPLLLAGLEPNCVVYAASPLDCFKCIGNFLQAAILNHFGSAQDIYQAMQEMQSGARKYLAQNNVEIINGTFDMHSLTLPKEMKGAKQVRVNITMASQGYKEVKNDPELSLGIYKDIVQADLSKKFETQQFLHHYLMKRYEIPLKLTLKGYPQGIQKLSGIIDMTQIQNQNMPMQVVVRYTKNGFRKNLKREEPSTLVYAYLMEFERIR